MPSGERKPRSAPVPQMRQPPSPAPLKVEEVFCVDEHICPMPMSMEDNHDRLGCRTLAVRQDSALEPLTTRCPGRNGNPSGWGLWYYYSGGCRQGVGLVDNEWTDGEMLPGGIRVRTVMGPRLLSKQISTEDQKYNLPSNTKLTKYTVPSQDGYYAGWECLPDKRSAQGR